MEEEKMTDELGAKPPQKRRGVAAGRIAAAGIGLAAMAGLVANMEVASSKTPAQPAQDTGPRPTLGALRWEQNAFHGPATQPRRIADAGKVRPIVLTPHTVVHTMGGGSSGGGSGGYTGGSSGGYSAAAPAAAPVASSGGSR
jgi:hypothetical protein